VHQKLVVVLVPNEITLHFLSTRGEVLQWFLNPHKSPVESLKTKKTPNLRDHGRKWIAHDGNKFCLIDLNALRCHNISKTRHTIGAKGALHKVTK
jgi:hypothetical protein